MHAAEPRRLGEVEASDVRARWLSGAALAVSFVLLLFFITESTGASHLIKGSQPATTEPASTLPPVPCVDGATGPSGEPGASGATGAEGDTGAVGATGDQGEVGVTGVTGKQGEIGRAHV